MSASFPDLPVELLCQIFEHLDNATLCTLGSTCKALNDPVFTWFFYKHQVMRGPDILDVVSNSSNYVLRAMRCSLAMQKCPASVSCRFDLNTLSNLVEQVHDLRVVVGRAKEIDSLKLDLGSLDIWRPYHESSSRPTRVGSKEWAQALTDLVVVATSKGCLRLEIEGGAIFYNSLEQHDIRRLSESIANPMASVSTLFRRISRRLSKGISTDRGGRPPFLEDRSIKLKQTRSRPKLQVVRLTNDMSFRPEVIDWTIQTLACSASTLVELRVGFPAPGTPSSSWHKFAETVFLPRLTTFRLFSGLNRCDSIQPSDIALFLVRHPSIERLHLEGVPVPGKLSLLPKIEGSILPNLVYLQAHSYYIQWIFGKGHRPPNLKWLMVSVDSFRSGESIAPYDYASLDSALEKMQAPQPKESLAFQFNEVINFVDWLQSHVDRGSVTGSLFSRFTGPWQTLIVQFPWREPLDSLEGHMELFFLWVALFPRVERLTLQVIPWKQADEVWTSMPNLALLHALAPQLNELVTPSSDRAICIRRSLKRKNIVYRR